MSEANTNPFEVLRLDPATPTDEVVRQAGRLRQRATDEAAVAAVRQAVQALTGRPEERLLHELLTHPAPCHVWPALDRFTAAFRRPPLPAGEAQATCPAPDLAEVAALLRPLAAAELDAAPPPFEPVGEAEDRAEIVRQTVEGIWQTLPFDMRA
ncbi:MAG TPA: hypothetical protein VKA46_29890 [Gemmataceae bacterium]|nr:hypothetical protein [Gemmataceae bacterium]